MIKMSETSQTPNARLEERMRILANLIIDRIFEDKKITHNKQARPKLDILATTYGNRLCSHSR